MINDLTLIRPVLSNTDNEIWDYIKSFSGLSYLKLMKQLKTNPFPKNFDFTKELIQRNAHYLKLIITDNKQLLKQRKAENNFSRLLVR